MSQALSKALYRPVLRAPGLLFHCSLSTTAEEGAMVVGVAVVGFRGIVVAPIYDAWHRR